MMASTRNFEKTVRTNTKSAESGFKDSRDNAKRTRKADRSAHRAMKRFDFEAV